MMTPCADEREANAELHDVSGNNPSVKIEATPKATTTFTTLIESVYDFYGLRVKKATSSYTPLHLPQDTVK
jgi:hypothetical protein